MGVFCDCHAVGHSDVCSLAPTRTDLPTNHGTDPDADPDTDLGKDRQPQEQEVTTAS